MYFLIMKTKSLTSLLLLTLLFFHISFSMVFADDFQDAMDAANKEKYREAFRLFRQSAEQGNASAQLNVGYLYDKGLGVPQDHKKAFKWYRMAAEQGISEAQYRVGYLYDMGWGVPQDYKKAFKWYRIAAVQGHADAQYSVGYLYDMGLGVSQDYVLAHMWFSLSGLQGYQYARESRNVTEKKMTPQQIEKAQGLARSYEEEFGDSNTKTVNQARKIIQRYKKTIKTDMAYSEEELNPKFTKREFSDYYKTAIAPRLETPVKYIRDEAIHWVDVNWDSELDIIFWTEGIWQSLGGIADREFLYVIEMKNGLPVNLIKRKFDFPVNQDLFNKNYKKSLFYKYPNEGCGYNDFVRGMFIVGTYGASASSSVRFYINYNKWDMEVNIDKEASPVFLVPQNCDSSNQSETFANTANEKATHKNESSTANQKSETASNDAPHQKDKQTYPKVMKTESGGYKVVLGVFETKILAEIRADSLKKGLTPEIEQRGNTWELFLGPYPSKEEAYEARP